MSGESTLCNSIRSRVFADVYDKMMIITVHNGSTLQVFAFGLHQKPVAAFYRQHCSRYPPLLHIISPSYLVMIAFQEKLLPVASSTPHTQLSVAPPQAHYPTSWRICSTVCSPPPMSPPERTLRAVVAANLLQLLSCLPLISGLILLFGPKLFSVLIFQSTRNALKLCMPSDCSAVAA